MDALVKELAAALAKVRKQYEIVKFENDFYATSEMSFQKLPGSDGFLALIQKDTAVPRGVPFLWEGPVALDFPEFLILRPKSSSDVYVLAPNEILSESLIEEEMKVALTFVSDDNFPFEVGSSQYSKDQMAFLHIPELEEMLLAQPSFASLKFDGLPCILSLVSGDKQDQTKLIACGSKHDGKLYFLTPIVM